MWDCIFQSFLDPHRQNHIPHRDEHASAEAAQRADAMPEEACNSLTGVSGLVNQFLNEGLV
jgi:hypothetical protein